MTDPKLKNIEEFVPDRRLVESGAQPEGQGITPIEDIEVEGPRKLSGESTIGDKGVLGGVGHQSEIDSPKGKAAVSAGLPAPGPDTITYGEALNRAKLKEFMREHLIHERKELDPHDTIEALFSED